MSPVGAEFVGPPWKLVPELIDDLVAFAGRVDVPPLVSAALTHAQFETIHPFTTGTSSAPSGAAKRYSTPSTVSRSAPVDGSGPKNPSAAQQLPFEAGVAGFHAVGHSGCEDHVALGGVGVGDQEGQEGDAVVFVE